jgi:hypothetical protein
MQLEVDSSASTTTAPTSTVVDGERGCGVHGQLSRGPTFDGDKRVGGLPQSAYSVHLQLFLSNQHGDYRNILEHATATRAKRADAI